MGNSTCPAKGVSSKGLAELLFSHVLADRDFVAAS